MIEPRNCKSLDEVRSEIDRLDRSLITTIGRRQEYVHAAARFKRSQEQVHASECQRSMLAARRHWADLEGVDPDLIETLFRTMVAHFIKLEMTVFSEKKGRETGGQHQPTSTEAVAGKGSPLESSGGS